MTGCQNRLPDLVGHVGRHEDLETVFARIARAGDHRAGAGDLAVCEPERLDLREVNRRQLLEHLSSGRTLQGNEAVAAARVDCGCIAYGTYLLLDPRKVFGNVARVHHDEEVARPHAVDDHVVQEGALWREQA